MRIFQVKSSVLSTILLCFSICVIYYVVAIVALAVSVFFVLSLMNCSPHSVLIFSFFQRIIILKISSTCCLFDR